MAKEKHKSGEVLTRLLASRSFNRATREVFTKSELHQGDTNGQSRHGVVTFLAEKLGLHNENISMWLSGEHPIPQKHLWKIAGLLKLQPEEKFKFYESILFPDGVQKLSSVFANTDRTDLQYLVNGTINCICIDDGKNLATWESVYDIVNKKNDPDLLIQWRTAMDRDFDHIALRNLKSQHYFSTAAFAVIAKLPIKTEYKVLILAKAKGLGHSKTLEEIFNPSNLVTTEVKRGGQLKILKFRKLGDILRELRESHCVLNGEEKPLTWREAVNRVIIEDKFMPLARISPLTQGAVGRAIGITRRMVNYCEKGTDGKSQTRPNDEQLEELGRFYGLNNDMLEALQAMPTESVRYKRTSGRKYVSPEDLGMLPPDLQLKPHPIRSR